MLALHLVTFITFAALIILDTCRAAVQLNSVRINPAIKKVSGSFAAIQRGATPLLSPVYKPDEPSASSPKFFVRDVASNLVNSEYASLYEAKRTDDLRNLGAAALRSGFNAFAHRLNADFEKAFIKSENDFPTFDIKGNEVGAEFGFKSTFNWRKHFMETQVNSNITEPGAQDVYQAKHFRNLIDLIKKNSKTSI